jgi:hypothetical protein
MTEKNVFPKVDDGTIYPEITKFIQNGKFVFNLDDLMIIDELQKEIKKYSFTKVADCVLNIKENFPTSKRKFISQDKYEGKLIDYIPIPKNKNKWKEKNKEWIYIITYNKKIVKIGITSSCLESRYTSYSCGTKKAMKKGSCSTTNFIVTESNYLALLNGMNVEIYAYEIPQTITEENIFNIKRKVLNKIAHEYESTLIQIHQSMNGNIPPLCSACKQF